jgi:hypothetical protein
VNSQAASDAREHKRKQVVNDRLTKIYATCDKLKERCKLVVAESRAQGVYLQEQISEISQ